MSVRIRPDTAANMLARNIVGDTTTIPYIMSRLDNLDMLPICDSSDFLRHVKAANGAAMNVGTMEQLISSYHSQDFAKRLRYNNLAEDRGALDAYIEVLNNYAKLQQLRSATANMSLALADPEPDLTKIQRDFVMAMAAKSANAGLRDIASAADEAYRMVEQAHLGHVPGCSFGFGQALDDFWWAGPGEFSTIAGSPGSGKTSLVAGSILATATVEKPVAFFSLEMKSSRIALRMGCEISSVPYTKAFRGKTSRDELGSIHRALASLGGRGIFIDDGANNMTDMYYKIMSMRDKPSIVWIDYSELVQTDDLPTKQRNDLLIAEVYKAGRRIANDLNVHVAMLSQLTRDSDKSKDKWPGIRDLAQSSFAEKMSDGITLLMRPEYYLSRGQKCKLLQPSDATGVCYAIIGKSRNGAAGVVRLGYDAEHMRFHEYKGDAVGMALIDPEDDDED